MANDGLRSLWDLVAYSVHDLCKLLSHLNRQISQVYRRERERGPYALLDNTGTFNEVGAANMLLDCATKEFRKLELPSGMEQVSQLQLNLEEIGLAEYRTRLTTIRELLEGELKRRNFTYIPQERAEYYALAAPFGDRVASKFPEANKEARTAGNCLAADLSTAAVFHLMRCAEYGMRALARERGVEIKNIESLELAEWSQILQELDNKVKELMQLKGRSEAKKAGLEFYSGVAGELRGFKDEYRNHVCHARTPYGWNAAVDAFTKVRCFMERLALYLPDEDGEEQNGLKLWL